MVAPLVIAGAIAAGSALSNWMANRSQNSAARSASRDMLREGRRTRAFQLEMGDKSASILGDAMRRYGTGMQLNYGNARDALAGGTSDAMDIYGQGYNTSMANLSGGMSDARNTVGEGEWRATQNIAGGTNNALSALGSGYGDAASALGAAYSQYQDPSAAMLDPGMEFRRSQGEQAITRAQAARGGRVSGRSLKELADYNSGLASQEYGAAFGRQNTLDTQRANTLSGLANLYAQRGTGEAGVIQSGGSQLANIAMTGAGQRAGYSAQEGMSAADYAAKDAANRGGLAYNSGQNLANLYQSEGTNLANLGMQGSGQIASGYTGVANNYASLTPSMMQAYGMPVQYAGAGTAALGNGLSQLGQMYMLSQMGGR